MATQFAVKTSSSSKVIHTAGLSGQIRVSADGLFQLIFDKLNPRFGRRAEGNEASADQEASTDQEIELAKDERDRNCTRIDCSISGLTAESDISIALRNDTVVIRRDRFGRLPLYWLLRDGIVHLSTSSRELAVQFSLGVDDQAFYAYSCFSFIPAPLSPYAGLNSMHAGAELVFRVRGGQIERLETNASGNEDDPWNLAILCQSNAQGKSLSEAELIGLLSAQLEKSIEKQCHDLSGKDVAVFLSGGLDSALTAAALKRTGAKLTAYSLDFGTYGKPELPIAQELADYLNVPLRVVPCSPAIVRRNLNQTVEALDAPFGDGVSVPLFLLSKKAAADGQEIAFNGEGGDQLFGGWTNKPLIASAVYACASLDGNDGVGSNRIATEYFGTFHKLYGSERMAFSQSLQERVSQIDLNKYVLPALQDSAPDREARVYGRSLIHTLRRANLMLKGAQNIQPRASNLAMSAGLNLRTLFCNDDLAELTFSLPPEMFLKGACEKYILKQAVDSWMPSSIVQREKRGMGVPLTEWCLGPLWSFLGRYLNSGRLESTGYWQNDIAEKLVLCRANSAWQGRRIGEILWLILIWEIWNSLGLSDANKSYNSFWPPLLFWKLKREVLDPK